MAWEIERKFLVDARAWRPSSAGTPLRQGYISGEGGGSVRIRVAGGAAFLTIKGPAAGIRRLEFEYPIPLDDALVMLERLCSGCLVEKTRHREVHEGAVWEIDVFHGDNDGLVVAEIELGGVGETFARPHWAVAEVSDDPRYGNYALARRPFSQWAPAVA